jgi:hypothetical protein
LRSAAAIAAGGETNFNKKLKIFMTIINIPLRARIYFLRAAGEEISYLLRRRPGRCAVAAGGGSQQPDCALAVLAKLFN